MNLKRNNQYKKRRKFATFKQWVGEHDRLSQTV